MALFQKLFAGRQSPFIIITAAVVVWLLCLPLFQDGMFIDGIQYAAVARNLARGIGSFWNPVLAQNSVAGLNSFHEHPPLVFFIQSLFFKVFGLNNIYPERIYCLFTFLLTALFIALIWRKIFNGEPVGQLWWLPVFLWIIMPIVFWAYANDIQENTMGVFTTAAIYLFLAAVGTSSLWRTPNFYGGCFSVLLAVLCKGVPGLFPLVFFLVYWLCLKKISFRSALVYSLLSATLLAAAAFVILQNNQASQALHTWFFDRMLKRISSDPVAHGHFYILEGLFTEQLPAIIAVALALVVFRWRQISNQVKRGYVALFILLGLAASLPLMLTLVQRNFYFIPALPMFAIAWALLFADGLNHAIGQLQQMPKLKNAITAFALIGLLAGIITTTLLAGRIKRDKDVLHDVYAFKRIMPENSFVSVTSDIMWVNWSFRCYMMRYNAISFSEQDTCQYFIANTSEKAPDKFEPANIQLQHFRLYKAKQTRP
jgi:hypothetical protein